MGTVADNKALYSGVCRRWPWADNDVTKRWLDEHWTGDKPTIERAMDAAEWASELFPIELPPDQPEPAEELVSDFCLACSERIGQVPISKAGQSMCPSCSKHVAKVDRNEG